MTGVQTCALPIFSLYQEKKSWIAAETRSQFAVQALDWIFQTPIFMSSHFRDSAGIPAPTATRILRVCREGKMLKELRAGAGRRAAILCFPALLNIAEGREAF